MDAVPEIEPDPDVLPELDAEPEALDSPHEILTYTYEASFVGV